MSPPALTDALRDALEPFGSFRGEHAQLVAWLEESFALLETLHQELAEWETELDAQQEAWEQEQVAVVVVDESELQRLQGELGALRAEAEQWEADGFAQLEALEELERREASLAAECNQARQKSLELAAALEAERKRASLEREVWLSELCDLRRTLSERCDGGVVDALDKVATTASGDGPPLAEASPERGNLAAPPDGNSERQSHSTGLAAQLRLRAEQRRQARGQPLSEGTCELNYDL